MNQCDLDELKHRVREKALAELKEYIEGDGEWVESYSSLCSSDRQKVFRVSSHCWRSLTKDADVFSLDYKGERVYKVVKDRPVQAAEKKRRKQQEKDYAEWLKGVPAENLWKYNKKKYLPASKIPVTTPEDTHSEWFVEVVGNLYHEMTAAKECAKWEALLYDKPEKDTPVEHGVVAGVDNPPSRASSRVAIITGAVALIALIIGVALL